MKRSASSSTEPAFCPAAGFPFSHRRLHRRLLHPADRSSWPCSCSTCCAGGNFPRCRPSAIFSRPIIFFTLLSTVFSVDRAASIRDNKELLIFLLVPIYLWLLDSWKRVRLSSGRDPGRGGLFGAGGDLHGLAQGHGVVLSDRLTGFTSHWMTYAGLLMFPFIFFSVLLLLRPRRKRQAAASLRRAGGHAGRHRLFPDPQRLAGHCRRPGAVPGFFQTQVFPGAGAAAAGPGAAGAAGGEEPRAVHRRPAGPIQPRPDLHGLLGAEDLPGPSLDRGRQQQYRQGHRRQRGTATATRRRSRSTCTCTTISCRSWPRGGSSPWPVSSWPACSSSCRC